MFGKKKDQAPIKTLIAQGTRIDGALSFDEGLRVDGEVAGPIHAREGKGSLLVISEGGIAAGGVTADVVIINGTVKGPVFARELLELQPKARIEGDVQYVALEMHQGATIAGQLRPAALEGESAQGQGTVIRLAATGS